ncbi:IS1634 family transposase [Mycolicibacterium brumae]|uniref:IS1634 family transposase n=1 Tax=Mycolicibacterium brumae TaxID=85968 RepID=A0A2G5P510_9MYCO|nr:IS1634 family transposase [Mycolicibacterium brumae]MCV7192152.1 IS1634 family transposase [Mycolicibacterium brumae]PIB73356.1 IS1634 family transposase [Mycolicibacterium brumae]UWW10671.1 IS1634 family transposase [Mycolicibacterium brumae]
MRKAGRRDELVAHVGSAHTDAELGILLERARQMLDGDQETLDFEAPARTARVDDVADHRQQTLPAPGAAPTRSARASAPAPPGRTTGTCSRLLYDTVGAVYDWLGFGEIDDEVFRDLVIARIVEPTSKLDSVRVLADLGAAPRSYRTIQRHLNEVGPGKYRDTVAEKCFAYARDCGALSLILYDVTTLWWEAENEDDLPKVGYSKDRKVDPQIVVGLLVDRTGFPLEIGCYEGNTAETTTIVPVIRSFLDRHKLGETEMVVAADAGMLSSSNLKDLDELGLSFIVGSRATKAPADLESHFHWNGDAFTDGQVIDTVTPRHGNNKNVNDRSKRGEPVWDPETHAGAWRAIWAYSAKRARRDQKTLAAQEARAKDIVDGAKPAKTARFVKVSGKDRHLDQAALARAQSLVGLKGYVTNVQVTTMKAAEVMAKYHDLWHVEKSFRMSTSDLAARPIWHRQRETIEAHLTIVFAALAVSHAIQSRTGESIAKVVKGLRPLRSATIAINGTTHTFPPEIPSSAQEILRCLGVAH